MGSTSLAPRYLLSDLAHDASKQRGLPVPMKVFSFFFLKKRPISWFWRSWASMGSIVSVFNPNSGLSYWTKDSREETANPADRGSLQCFGVTRTRDPRSGAIAATSILPRKCWSWVYPRAPTPKVTSPPQICPNTFYFKAKVDRGRER